MESGSKELLGREKPVYKWLKDSVLQVRGGKVQNPGRHKGRLIRFFQLQRIFETVLVDGFKLEHKKTNRTFSLQKIVLGRTMCEQAKARSFWWKENRARESPSHSAHLQVLSLSFLGGNSSLGIF